MPGCLIVIALILAAILVSPWFLVGLVAWALLIGWASA